MDLGNEKVEKSWVFFEDVAGPHEFDKLFISSIPSLTVYDKQCMCCGPSFYEEYSFFDEKIHEKSISDTEKSIFH